MKRLPVVVAMLTALPAFLVLAPASGQAEPVSPVAQEAKPGVRKVHRDYGDGPVRLKQRDRRLQVTFDGRRGDRVRLETQGHGQACATIRLRRGGALVPEGRSGYHRLRRSGEHRFSFDPCRRKPTSVQLTKLLVKDLRTDGLRLSLPRRVGYHYAARVTVPRTERLLVRTDTPRRESGGQSSPRGSPSVD